MNSVEYFVKYMFFSKNFATCSIWVQAKEDLNLELNQI